MRVIIAGSRRINDYETVCAAVSASAFRITKVVSGGARDVDTLAVEYAEKHGVPCDVFHANWSQHGRSAGYRRNERMAQSADALIAVWDGASRGTKHMIDTAKARGLKVFVLRTNATGRAS